MYLEYKGWFANTRNKYFKKVLTKYVKEDTKLLDYGCGPGDMLMLCQEMGIDAIGVDVEDRVLDVARERGLNVRKADYDNLGFEENSFDAIFMQSVIEHLDNPVEVLTELRKYLKKDGLLIISSPTPGPHFWDDPTHIRPFTPQSFNTLADILDMKLIEDNYIFSFLMGVTLSNSIFYKILNCLPWSLGSNIIGVFRK